MFFYIMIYIFDVQILVLLIAAVGTVCAAPFWNMIKWKDSKEKKDKKSESLEQPTVIVKRPMYGEHSVVHDYRFAFIIVCT